MFKKLMASFGVGTAKVDLVLDKQQYRIGETIRGKAVVEGGNVDQQVNSLDIDLMLKFNIRGKEFSRVVHTINVANNFFVKEKKTVEFPVEHTLPADYPISKGSVSYHLITKMNIIRSTDSGDTDSLVILPGREMELVIEAFDILGFKEKIGSGRIEKFGQEFIYYPTTAFSDEIKELAFKFFNDNGNIKLFAEVRLLGSNMISGAAHYTEILILPELLRDKNGAGQIADHIREFIENDLKQVARSGPKPPPDFQSYQQQAASRPGFGGFAGGMVAGLLGAMMISSLFDMGGNQGPEGDMTEAEAGDDGDFGFDFGDFGDDI